MDDSEGTGGLVGDRRTSQRTYNGKYGNWKLTHSRLKGIIADWEDDK